MAASDSGNNKFAFACAGVRKLMADQNRPMRMGDLVGSSSFQPSLQLHLSPVPVAVSTGPAAAWETGTSTLPLFPVHTGSDYEMIFSPEENKATLTIFFQGQVATFPNFPADKARELIQMAASVTGNAPEKGVTTPVPEKAAETSDEPGAGMPPIARKLTLERFLRKRKNRMTGTDEPDKNQDASPWKKRNSTGAGNSAEEVSNDASWLRL